MGISRNVFVASLLSAMSVPALAAMSDSAGGNGELFWSVIDPVGERSYTQDLGLTMNDLLAGVAAGQSWSFAAQPLFQTFIDGTEDTTKLYWNLGALDGSGINRYVTTAAEGVAVPTYTNLIISGFNDNADIYLSASNALETHKSVADGSHIATKADGSAYAGQNWGTNFGQKAAGLDNSVAVIQSASLWLIQQKSTAFNQRFNPGESLQLANPQGLAYAASFGNGALTIAAVPEPETYALFGLGLVALGVMARRRGKR